jgi:3-oxosteroid 1-dehydrogenase
VTGRRLTYVDDNESGEQQAGVQAFGLPETRDPATGTTEPQGGNSGQPHDPLTFGTGVVASILASVLQEKGIEILVSHPVTELVTEEGGRVVGVRAQGPAGTVERRGAVVLATSTYDWDADLVEELVGLGPDDFGSVAPDSIRGDGIKLARQVGDDVVRMPATAVPPKGWSPQPRPSRSWAWRSASTESGSRPRPPPSASTRDGVRTRTSDAAR